eukprot:scaffold116871_cov75-Phaeocystis_antarctica.AAC.1
MFVDQEGSTFGVMSFGKIPAPNTVGAALADLTSHVILGAGQLDFHRLAHLGRSLPFAAASSALGQAERTL